MGVEWTALSQDPRPGLRNLQTTLGSHWTFGNEKVEGKERAGVGTGEKQVLSDPSVLQAVRLFEGVPS